MNNKKKPPIEFSDDELYRVALAIVIMTREDGAPAPRGIYRDMLDRIYDHLGLLEEAAP